jgi:hypothetical protein
LLVTALRPSGAISIAGAVPLVLRCIMSLFLPITGLDRHTFAGKGL